MDEARARTGRTPRLLSRTLVVLGGTIAATAAAWLISSASASAATGSGPLTGPGSAVGSLTEGIGRTVTTSLPAAPTALPAAAEAAAGWRRVSGELRGAVANLGRHVPTGGGLGAALPTLPVANHTVPVDQHGPAAPLSVPFTARPTAVGGIPAAPTVHTVAAPTGWARAVHHPATPVAIGPGPGTPAAPPQCPVTVPAAPAGSSSQAPTGGLGCADQATRAVEPALDTVGTCPATRPLGRVSAGRQPGTTPD